MKRTYIHPTATAIEFETQSMLAHSPGGANIQTREGSYNGNATLSNQKNNSVWNSQIWSSMNDEQ